MMNTISHTGGDEEIVEIHQVRFQVSCLSEFLKNLRRIGKEHSCSLICFNRQVIAGRQHVVSAVLHAERSFRTGDSIARNIEVEALLYAAGTRQTGLIAPFGVHEGENECYLCAIPPRSGVYDAVSGIVRDAESEDWEMIDPGKEHRLCELFGITDAELAVTGRDRIRDLVLERVALLVVNR